MANARTSCRQPCIEAASNHFEHANEGYDGLSGLLCASSAAMSASVRSHDHKSTSLARCAGLLDCGGGRRRHAGQTMAQRVRMQQRLHAKQTRASSSCTVTLVTAAMPCETTHLSATCTVETLCALAIELVRLPCKMSALAWWPSGVLPSVLRLLVHAAPDCRGAGGRSSDRAAVERLSQHSRGVPPRRTPHARAIHRACQPPCVLAASSACARRRGT
eukprot:2048655-Prymnesium_polylepis.2